MTTSSSEQEQKTVSVDTETYVCQNCGGLMKFNIKNQKFSCESCKAEYDLQTLSDSVKENDFNSYLERERTTVPFEGMAVVSCQRCGMEISFSETQFSTNCPMCGSTQVATVKQSAGIPPDGLVPFKIDKKDAQERFKSWVKSRWFAPNDFKNRYGEGGLSGMYLPFWTYDAYAVSFYKGRGGKDRKEKDKDGKERTVTDWYPVSGFVNASFDDIQICASNKEKNIEGILPYDTINNTKPFSAGYLSGYYAEVYKIKADAGFESAKKIMERKLQSLAESDIKKRYDRADVQSLSTKYSNVTYKHVLLPLWSSAFGYKGKTYAYAINGETGKVSGNRPYSPIKILLAILTILALIGAIFYFTQEAPPAAVGMAPSPALCCQIIPLCGGVSRSDGVVPPWRSVTALQYYAGDCKSPFNAVTRAGDRMSPQGLHIGHASLLPVLCNNQCYDLYYSPAA